MTLHGPIEPGRPVLLFGHGAGAGQSHPWIRHVATRLAARGVTVATFDFPYIQAHKRLPDRGPILEQAYAREWEALGGAVDKGTAVFAGGKSMGGRIATQAASSGQLRPSPVGLVCFGYPLHPPGQPHRRRDAHLGEIRCPVLFLHGTRDPFGTPEEMMALEAGTGSTLHLVEGGNHSLETPRGTPRAPKTEAPGLDQAIDVAAEWILARAAGSER